MHRAQCDVKAFEKQIFVVIKSKIEPRFREMASKTMIQVSQQLRKRQTSAEQELWEHLKNRRLDRIKFRRQHPIANTVFVADFFCYESHLVIELDGSIHEHQQVADQSRQTLIEEAGNYVVRFNNEQVFGNLENVLMTILQCHSTLTKGTGTRNAPSP